MKEYKFEERTVGYILEDKAKTIGEKPFLLHEDVKITYKELDEKANRVANGLLGLGIKKGDKVCLIMGNSIEFLYTWFALAKIGAVKVPINIALKGNLLRYIIDHSDASVAIVDNDLVDRVVFVQNEIKKIKTIIIVPEYEEKEVGFGPQFKIRKFTELYKGSSKRPPSDVHFYDPMAILYTSGTTGPSKGAILSHAHYYFIAQQANYYMRYDEESVLYSCLPLFHANASMLSALGAMLAHGSYAMGKRFSLTTFWQEIRSYRATHTNILGSIFPLLWRQPPSEDDAKNPLKVMNTALLIPEFEEFERRFDLKLVTMYGTTETGIVMVSPFEEKIRPGFCGKPLKAYDAKIFDDNDIECGAETIGEIVVRGNEPYSQMDCYYNMPEATVKAFRNLWYHSGDFAYRDEDGYFYFVDRKKDALRRRGENISSFEVEGVISSHPKVLESAVFAVPSEFGEDDVMAAVVLKSGEKMTPEELIAFCEERMAYFAVPRYLEFRESLPKTPTARVEKYKLREEGVTKGTWDREKAGYKLKR
ncbi:MAG: ATP-dependent acyl-CoA ligase [Proteobacteria bacterium]|nr:ATP-dependent acyl-CoA ligase [Pseudomonadota bacterium]